MNKFVVLGACFGLLVACSSTNKDAPAPAKKTETAPTDPAAGDDDTDAGPSVDPCLCPGACASTDKAEKGWMVCSPSADPPPSDLPLDETIGKFYIGNFEYWPYAKPSPYPDDTICGYNGEQECGWNGAAKGAPPDAARTCMAQARKVLSDLLTNDVPPELEALRVAHGVNKFWNWNNDMTGTKSGDPDTRDLWLYEGTRTDHGLIKWISETERDGKCHLPTRADLVTFATACAKNFPNCDSGK